MIDWTLHIESNPQKLFGKPVIINTWVPVDLILEKLAAGDSIEDLLEAYPKVTKDDIAGLPFIRGRIYQKRNNLSSILK